MALDIENAPSFGEDSLPLVIGSCFSSPQRLMCWQHQHKAITKLASTQQRLPAN
jgi:hypothetical protein